MRFHSSACLCALVLLGCRSTDADVDSKRADVRFGLVADIQYADKDARGERRYREALDGWKGCVAAWREQDLDFAVQLGDLIDGRAEESESTRDLNYVLGVTAAMDVPVRHVVGNHDLEVPRPRLLSRLRLAEGHYSFTVDGWRFVVLDSMAVSTRWPAGSPQALVARRILDENAGKPNAVDWNGAFGSIQLDWLAAELAAAGQAGERVVVFAHAPVLAAASTPAHLAWDHERALELLEGQPHVAAYFSGHDHAGGYARAGGVHFVTVEGLVEADPEANAFAVVELYADRIEVLGVGEVTSRTLALDAQPSSISTE